MLQLYVKIDQNKEKCFSIDVSSELTQDESKILYEILAPGWEVDLISLRPYLDICDGKGVEIGPRMNFETAFSTNVVSTYHNIGLQKVLRVEKSIRYLTDNVSRVIEIQCDRMTQEVYYRPLGSFSLDRPVYEVVKLGLFENGIDAFSLLKGLSFSEQDKQIYYDYFVNKEKRNPTNVELFDLLNSNCEHSRHGWFNALQIIDGVEQEHSAFSLVKSTLQANKNGSVIGFHDNSSSIRGFIGKILIPTCPGQPSEFIPRVVDWDLTFTAETHNFPTGIAPYPGAATGTGGRLRDQMATGKGSNVIAGTIGYDVSSLHIEGYELSGENPDFHSPENMATGLEILIQGSNGASNYGNEFGEPLIQGYSRNFDLRIPNGERWAYVKPILFTGGIGQMRHEHHEKGHAEKGLLIVQVGGPAYRIGFGGGAASSMHQGDNDAELDFNAVQRGNAEMEKKLYNVVRTCNEMGENSPIVSTHDQGAGGPGNILKELVEESGGRVDIRKINSGDPTLSVLELWVCEFQERGGFLIPRDRIEEFLLICEREKVPCEILGEVTGDGRFVVEDSHDGSTPVDFDLKAILADFPRTTYEDTRIDLGLQSLEIPDELTVSVGLERVFKLLSVGSKGYLVHKADRSVSGLIAQQQCVGPLQLPLSNVAVIALSHFELSGGATAQGEKSPCMIVNPEAGARLSIAEMLMNMMCAGITDIKHVKCSVNWMWAPKKPGEGAALYDAVNSMSQFMPLLGVAADGGKDSLSMAAEVNGELVKSPRTMVVSGYAPVADITKVVTPDIKKPGESQLLYIDLSADLARLGGSAFAQSLGQIGNECPDIDTPELLLSLFDAIQGLITEDFILSYHDISDGGLITTLCEMAMAGNCGIDVNIQTQQEAINKLFAEEPGIIIEVQHDYIDEVLMALSLKGVGFQKIGETIPWKHITIHVNDDEEFNLATKDVRQWWNETSYQLEKQQGNTCADDEKMNTDDLKNPQYSLSFVPEITSKEILESDEKTWVAVIREEGSNGDREMISALYMAGLCPVDITMYDLLNKKVDLAAFRGAVFVGGFSYADYPESAKGWAATIRNNPRLKTMFTAFKERSDTWSFGVCNGCQMMALLGWAVSSDIPEVERPRFVKNVSDKFESRYTTVKIPESRSIMFSGMSGSVLPVWSAHAEGQIFADQELLAKMRIEGNVPVLYADNEGEETQDYPFNPNGSPLAIAGLCSSDGRHTIMMPHPERLFQTWQFSWLPEEMQNLTASPWLKIFQNAREWCEQN
ncbi:phosphoribosylformylglycinamidine synthase [Candidatus Gracilibacteria bacterium 28_42_T64]|nr:phosphoribosylformylglycinamidine synthase [Candidatus Gracilibacteria bacterium 28_42_T64]